MERQKEAILKVFSHEITAGTKVSTATAQNRGCTTPVLAILASSRNPWGVPHKCYLAVWLLKKKQTKKSFSVVLSCPVMYMFVLVLCSSHSSHTLVLACWMEDSSWELRQWCHRFWEMQTTASGKRARSRWSESCHEWLALNCRCYGLAQGRVVCDIHWW